MNHIITFSIVLGVCAARNLVKRSQSPKVWDALNQMKGKNSALTVEQIQELYLTVKPGEDFPILSVIPPANVDCTTSKPGFYANDKGGQCQSFDRCDINGVLSSYLCPNMTLFNQITMICDWWYNVDCAQARGFYDYSNSNLYAENAVFLENQDEIAEATGAIRIRASGSESVSSSSSGGKTKHKRKM